MKRVLGYSLLGLLAYGVFMLIEIPATVMTDLIAQHVPEFTVQDTRGSALRGSALGIRLRTAQFESLSWQLRFLPLLLGRLKYQFKLTEPEGQLQGTIATGFDRRYHLDNLKGSLPLAKLAILIGRPILPLSGQVKLDVADLQFNVAGHLRGASGTIHLLSTRTTLGKPLALGDFSVELSSQEQDIVGSVKDNGGPLEFTGNLTLAQDGSYRFKGQASVRNENDRDLRQALSILGRPGGDGKWKINFSGIL